MGQTAFGGCLLHAEARNTCWQHHRLSHWQHCSTTAARTRSAHRTLCPCPCPLSCSLPLPLLPAGASDVQCHRMFRFYWWVDSERLAARQTLASQEQGGCSASSSCACAGPVRPPRSLAWCGVCQGGVLPNLSALLPFVSWPCCRTHRFIFAFVFVTLIGLLVAAALKSALHWTRPFW